MVKKTILRNQMKPKVDLVMKTTSLEKVFNPSEFGVTYYEEIEKEDFDDDEKKNVESELYHEIINGLEGDLIEMGTVVTYSSKILMGEVAMSLILMNRLKVGIICKSLLRDKKRLRPESVSYSQAPYSKRYSKSIYHQIVHVYGDDEIHPLFDKLIPKLQKQINEGLKNLGLLPFQQLGKQKLMGTKKLKEKFRDSYEEISVEISREKEKFVKKLAKKRVLLKN